MAFNGFGSGLQLLLLKGAMWFAYDFKCFWSLRLVIDVFRLKCSTIHILLFHRFLQSFCWVFFCSLVTFKVVCWQSSCCFVFGWIFPLYEFHPDTKIHQNTTTLSYQPKKLLQLWFWLCRFFESLLGFAFQKPRKNKLNNPQKVP